MCITHSTQPVSPNPVQAQRCSDQRERLEACEGEVPCLSVEAVEPIHSLTIVHSPRGHKRGLSPYSGLRAPGLIVPRGRSEAYYPCSPATCGLRGRGEGGGGKRGVCGRRLAPRAQQRVERRQGCARRARKERASERAEREQSRAEAACRRRAMATRAALALAQRAYATRAAPGAYDASALWALHARAPGSLAARAAVVGAQLLRLRAAAALDGDMARRAVRVRSVLASLGPAFVKAGQALSTRGGAGERRQRVAGTGRRHRASSAHCRAPPSAVLLAAFAPTRARAPRAQCAALGWGWAARWVAARRGQLSVRLRSLGTFFLSCD